MASRRPHRTRIAALLLALTGLTAGALTVAGQATASPAARSAAPAAATTTAAAPEHVSCATKVKGGVRCLSTWHRTTQPAKAGTIKAAVAAPKQGLTPANIRAAYTLPKTGAAQTIAIVDAYDNPNVEADLKAYRAAFKLPACTTANKCFRKVDQRGGTTYPDGDPGWGVEIALDVEAVSAACHHCKILLVEADDASFDAIGAAVNTAVKLGADIVSNSYGGDEFNGTATLGTKYYTHPGVAIVASSGDYGFGAASFPAVLPTTWAIGGTFLSPTKKGGFTEDAWNGAGSGCSAWFTKPTYQKDKNCSMRTVADISAVADSADGFAVYDTYGLGADNGWIGVGGTSLSAPLISGMIGLAGNSVKAARPSYAYAHRTGLADVTGGSNGFCGGDYLCTGVKGYDGPTGLGSPRGLKSL
jgi:subtilase family serine protease